MPEPIVLSIHYEKIRQNKWNFDSKLFTDIETD